MSWLGGVCGARLRVSVVGDAKVARTRRQRTGVECLRVIFVREQGCL